MTVEPGFLQHANALTRHFLSTNNIDLNFLHNIVGDLGCHVTIDRNLTVLMRVPSGTNNSRVVVLTKRVLERYQEGTKSCPNCGTIGYISDVFGWRNCAGTVRPQSWCTSCRSSKAA